MSVDSAEEAELNALNYSVELLNVMLGYAWYKVTSRPPENNKKR